MRDLKTCHKDLPNTSYQVEILDWNNPQMPQGVLKKNIEPYGDCLYDEELIWEIHLCFLNDFFIGLSELTLKRASITLSLLKIF